DRYVEFGSVGAVEETLNSLSGRSAPLARNLGRSPGQSQDRWTHTLGTDEEKMVPRGRPPRSDAAAGGDGATAAGSTGLEQRGGHVVTRAEYEELESRLRTLERRVSLLETGH